MENLNWNFLKTLLHNKDNEYQTQKCTKICIQCKVIEAESYLGISVSRVACHPQNTVLKTNALWLIIEKNNRHFFTGDWESGPDGDGTYTFSTEIEASEALQNNGSIYLHSFVGKICILRIIQTN